MNNPNLFYNLPEEEQESLYMQYATALIRHTSEDINTIEELEDEYGSDTLSENNKWLIFLAR